MLVKNRTMSIVFVGVFAALAFVAMLIDFPLPFFPPYLKFDISDVFIFMAGILTGPWGLIAAAVIKNLLHFIFKGAAFGIPIDQIASLLSTLAFVLPAYFFAYGWKRKVGAPAPSLKKLAIGLAIGTVSLAIVMTVANYFFITPLYFALGNMPLPENYLAWILMYLPFNLIKGVLLSVILLVLYPHFTRLFAKY